MSALVGSEKKKEEKKEEKKGKYTRIKMSVLHNTSCITNSHNSFKTTFQFRDFPEIFDEIIRIINYCCTWNDNEKLRKLITPKKNTNKSLVLQTFLRAAISAFWCIDAYSLEKHLEYGLKRLEKEREK